jgi:DNA-binding MarR family transcriptional regulator
MGDIHPDEDVRELAAALIEVSAMLVRELPNRHGMSLTTMSTLGRLDREGPLRITALAAAEGIAQPSMTQLVQKLQRHGLLTRLPDRRDGRVCLVELTDAGRRMLAERRQDGRDWLTARLAALPGGERDQLDAAVRAALPIVRQVTQPLDHPAAQEKR